VLDRKNIKRLEEYEEAKISSFTELVETPHHRDIVEEA
jgi:hypothetical protein